MTREEAIKVVNNLKQGIFPADMGIIFDALCLSVDALKEERPHGEWKEDSDDNDVRCSHCGIAIYALNKSNHEMLNALTGGKWWTHYRYCPMCGSINGGEANEKNISL